MFTKADSLRGLKRKDRLRPGQRARQPLKVKGKYGKLWDAFAQRMYKRWFDEELGKGQLPELDEKGRENVVRVFKHCMSGEWPAGHIRRWVGTGGIHHYQSPDGCVAHDEGHGKDRRPDQRCDPSVVSFSSRRWNAWLETIAQKEDNNVAVE